jgi:hypothetical protein
MMRIAAFSSALIFGGLRRLLWRFGAVLFGIGAIREEAPLEVCFMAAPSGNATGVAVAEIAGIGRSADGSKQERFATDDLRQHAYRLSGLPVTL